MTFLSQSPHFVGHDVLGLASPRGLRNAGRHFSQFFLGRDYEIITTPVDVSKSLRLNTLIPYSMLQDVPCINNLLPVEIIGEIFRHYVFDVNPDPITGYSRITAHAGARTSAISLCHVCSYWRTLAFSISNLWSSLCVIWPKMGYIHLVRLWLEKSRSRPLSLYLAQYHSSEDHDIVAMRQILELCIATAPRWRDISLNVTHALQDMFYGLEEGSIEFLESFDVGLSKWSQCQQSQLLNAFYASPFLRRVEWRLFERALPANPPWKQLSAVTLNCQCDAEEFFTVLSQCDRLESLDVNVRFIVSASPTSHSTLSLPNLFDLRLGMMSTKDFELLFNYLVLPRLEIIDMRHGFEDSSPQGWISLRNLLSRSFCQLSSFTYGGYNLDEAEFISALTSSNLSSLVDLSLSLPITDNIIGSLTNEQIRHESPPLPLLRHLAFSNCQTSDGVLSTFVSSRMLTLRSVEVYLRGVSAYSADLTAMKSFQRENLAINIVLYSEVSNLRNSVVA
ncbi:uncharacterized protein LACBIDRAFT_328135 [Laccaria bicolor S238N-H82]|uniref:Predicted protein n=1 Tax=Laccaria bicolor (strain S238N-H82 / ATCC MYA-4686) TaxID=486041 RepID=B0DDV4_LACBS|nr:uncharacterized protein LACBIDRAFT_328135 [Laccaria bicolor S238N-H82]EDR07283.1 predicted protein [Laccaria bicolor S238N-H82]|eukprot:XP_001882214.1 predicted protein [Laccaria bicolor S238N-H82]